MWENISSDKTNYKDAEPHDQVMISFEQILREIASELIDVHVSWNNPFNVQRLTRSVIIYVIYKRNFHRENQK